MKIFNYKIFLSINFDSNYEFLTKPILEIAEEEEINLHIADPGSSAKNPPENVKNNLKSVEGILVLMHKESNWIRNEIGMAFGLNLPIFLLCSNDLKINDIARFLTSYKKIDFSDSDKLKKSTKNAFSKLKKAINSRRKDYQEPLPIDKPVEIYHWDFIYHLIIQSHKAISLDISSQGGFKPTLILGISRGGIIVADVLSRLGGDSPLGILEADRKSVNGKIDYKDKPLEATIKTHLNSFKGRDIRILIVDDVTKTGNSLSAALKKVKNISEKIITNKRNVFYKTLVLITQQPENSKNNPDYFYYKVPSEVTIQLPWGLG